MNPASRLLKSAVVIALIAAIALILSCSHDDPVAPTTPETTNDVVDTFTITPAAPMAGTLVKVSELNVSSSQLAECRFYLDNNLAPYTWDADSGISVAVPLFLDSTGWSNPPSTPLTLQLKKGDTLIAVARTPITVSTLERADGSLQNIKSAAESMATSIDALYRYLPPAYSDREYAVREGIVAMIDGIANNGDTSLAAILDGTSSVWQGETPDLKLLDAVLASTGAVDLFETYADGLSALQDTVASLRSASLGNPYCNCENSPDLNLACLMQIYTLLDAFSQQVVTPTATTYNNTVGLVAGLVAISGIGSVPGAVAEITGALLTIESFVMEKLVVAALPSKILAYEMALESDTIGIGDMTNSNIVISAQNQPVPISINDVINQILAAMPFLDLPSSDRFGAVLLRAAQFIIDLYRNILLQYEQDHPGSFTDPELTSIPLIVYGPVLITHEQLTRVITMDADIALPDDTALEWHGEKEGSATIRAETRGPGSKATLVRAWMFGTDYSGGAFGEEMASTDNVTLVVKPDTRLVVRIQGLPDGVPGDAQVSGPEGYARSVTVTDTLKQLKPGDYTIHASAVTDNGSEYIPDPIDQTITVTENESTSATVTYKPNSGRIVLTIAGLSADIAPDISVTGPGTNFHYGDARSGDSYDVTVDSLPPGTYTITASPVSDPDGVLYQPDPASQSVEVVSDSISRADVMYQAPVIVRILAGSRNDEGNIPLSRCRSVVRHEWWTSTTSEGDTLTDTACVPLAADLPFYYYGDSCGDYFDIGREEITGSLPYETNSTAGGYTQAHMMFIAQNPNQTGFRLDWDGEVTANLPSMGSSESWNLGSNAYSRTLSDTANHPPLYVEFENTGVAKVYVSRSYSFEIIKEGKTTYWNATFCDDVVRCGSQSSGANCFLSSSSSYGDSLIVSHDGSGGYSFSIPGKSKVRLVINWNFEMGASAYYTPWDAANAKEGGTVTLLGYIEYFVKRSRY